jgi:hypothetical protein
MCSTVPPNPPPGQDVFDLVATIRRHAFDRTVTPVDALIDIRDPGLRRRVRRPGRVTLLAGRPTKSGCPRCRSYLCAGHAPPHDCMHGVAEAAWHHELGDHRFFQADSCSWAAEVRPAVLAAGLGRGTPDRPLALVLVSPASGRALFGGLTFRDHREAKPARTRAGGGGWRAKARAFLVCARCRSLH